MALFGLAGLRSKRRGADIKGAPVTAPTMAPAAEAGGRLGRPPVGHGARRAPSPAPLKTKGTRRNFRETKMAFSGMGLSASATPLPPPASGTSRLAGFGWVASKWGLEIDWPCFWRMRWLRVSRLMEWVLGRPFSVRHARRQSRSDRGWHMIWWCTPPLVSRAHWRR